MNRLIEGMSFEPDSSPHASNDKGEGVPELSDFSFYPLNPDFFQSPEGKRIPSVISLTSSLTVEEVTRITRQLQTLRISLPEFNVINDLEPLSEADKTTILITLPRDEEGRPHFNPSYLRATIGRDLGEKELTMISLVTRSIAREILKIVDEDSLHELSIGGVKEIDLRTSRCEISARLEDFLISVPRFDPIRHEMLCNATYIGFARSRLAIPLGSEEGDYYNLADGALEILEELFINAVCTLYSSKDPKPVRWGQIAADPGVYAVLDGIISACNELNLMEYSSKVCGFTNQESVLSRVQIELEKHWKRSQIIES